MNHTFVICAYRDSPYLEECIMSLLKQTVRSEIIICTSTPTQTLERLAEEYSLPVIVNTRTKGITQDWNFGYAQAKTQYVTLAHQDDVYEPEYAEKIIGAMAENPDALIAFTGYGELRAGMLHDNSLNLKIKKLLLSPMRVKSFSRRVCFKRAILSFGNPVCCPAVTFNKYRLPASVFTAGFRSNEDWQAWERLSRLPGAFCYIPEIGMYHRIHEGSETSSIIHDNQRSGEDYAMFRKFWPPVTAKLLTRVYALSEKSNSLEGDQ